MISEIEAAVTKLAIAAANNFFCDFQHPLDPEKTDWEAIAWGEDQSIVEDLDETEDPNDYEDLYTRTLIGETLRLWHQFRATFEVEADGWSIEVTGWGSGDNTDDDRHWACMKVHAIDYEITETQDDGTIVVVEAESTCPSDEQIISALPTLPDDKIYHLGEWQGAEGKYIVRLIDIRDRPFVEALAYQLSRECDLEVIVA
jgi:hypothetical protein